MKSIVVSGINLNEGGTLSVFKDCLDYLSRQFSHKYQIIALVHDVNLFQTPNITYYEFKDSKSSWLKRLRYEYIHFAKLSRQIHPHLWLSMHDITPNIQADIKSVYCHNPSIFYNMPFKDILCEPKVFLFSLFYRYLYAINIRKNDYVIVQQDWIRDEFKRMYYLKDVIVAYPDVDIHADNVKTDCKTDSIVRFFYPSFPRTFKNFEIICDAVSILEARGINNFEVLLTINGSETSYSRRVFRQYTKLSRVKFIGLQSRENVYKYYNQCDCLIFASKLETWGMPITEYKLSGKPMLLANLRYAHETAGTYEQVKFFDPEQPEELANCMEGIIKGTLRYDKTVGRVIEEPFARTWEEMFNILLEEKGA